MEVINNKIYKNLNNIIMINNKIITNIINKLVIYKFLKKNHLYKKLFNLLGNTY